MLRHCRKVYVSLEMLKLQCLHLCKVKKVYDLEASAVDRYTSTYFACYLGENACTWLLSIAGHLSRDKSERWRIQFGLGDDGIMELVYYAPDKVRSLLYH